MAHINGWYRPTPKSTKLIIRSEAYELRSHYDPRHGSARCQEAGCELCSQRGEPKTTHVHVVELANSLHIFELNPGALEEPLALGDIIFVSRRKLGDFVETFIRREGSCAAARVWPANYLAALGQRAYERAVRAPRQDDFAI